MQKWLKVAILAGVTGAAICAGMLAYVAAQSRPHIYADMSEVPQAEVAIVLGASVTSSGQLSTILKERADRAVELYRAGKVKKILVTGDNGTLAHNEVDPTGRYLASIGIKPDDIFLDHAGFDTYSSMYRARDVFAVRSAIIVTQEFHLPRAVYLARKMGLTVYGIAPKSESTRAYNYVREIPATVKALYDVSFDRTPKYLGPQYPITGDGRATWGSATTTRPDILFL